MLFCYFLFILFDVSKESRNYRLGILYLEVHIFFT